MKASFAKMLGRETILYVDSVDGQRVSVHVPNEMVGHHYEGFENYYIHAVKFL